MHSSEGAVSEGGDSLDSLSLQDFQGSASEEDKEEGAASEEKDLTTRDDVRDVVVAFMKVNAEFERNMMAEFRKWTNGYHQDRRDLTSRQSGGIKMDRQSINY